MASRARSADLRHSRFQEIWAILRAVPVDRTVLDRSVDELASSLAALAARIHENPELRYEAHKASSWIAEALENAPSAIASAPSSSAARAALACGVEVEIKLRPGYRDLRNNMTVGRCFSRAMEELGRLSPDHDERVGAGSTDMGDEVKMVVGKGHAKPPAVVSPPASAK